MNRTVYNHHNDEDWQHCSEDINDAARCYLEILLEDYTSQQVREMFSKSMTITLYKGEEVKCTFSDYFDVNYMLEIVSDNAYDNVGDWASGYLYNVTPEQKGDLKKLVCDWADRHQLHPSFYSIEKISEVDYTVPDWLLEEVLMVEENLLNCVG